MFFSGVSAYSDTYLAFGILYAPLAHSWNRRGMVGPFRWAPSYFYVGMENLFTALDNTLVDLGDMQLRIILRCACCRGNNVNIKRSRACYKVRWLIFVPRKRKSIRSSPTKHAAFSSS
ncbi:hypothetical protein BHM03_00033567 [Ensete ventricosum]|nr:hypothetical protein BHM03_00033567 [Ensete ventricosum]